MSDRPIVFFDTETTGLELDADRVVQIALIKYNSLEDDEISDEFITYVNPDGRRINPEAAAVHGITEEMVADAPKFKDIAEYVKDFIGNAALSGYNIRAFDIPVLMNEYAWCNLPFNWVLDRPILDARTLWLQKDPRTLEGALRRFCNKELIDAHDAKADTVATAEVLKAQIKEFGLEGLSLEEIEKEEDPAGDWKGVIGSKARLRKTDDDIIFMFGKYKGESLITIAKTRPDYLEWMLEKNFEKTLKDIIRRLLKQLYPDWVDPTERV